MTASSYGAKSRRPVYSGNRRVPGLYERTLADGSTVYEAASRLGGKVRRHRLAAATKTDAVLELRALQTDYARGESYRSAAAGVTVADAAAEWLAHLEARVGHRDPRRRVAARTVDAYRLRLETHVLPELGPLPVAAVTVADLRRLADRLSGKLAPSSVAVVLAAASGLFRHAVRQGLAERNPLRDLDRDDRPSVRRLSEPRYLTAPELDRLLAELGDVFRPVAAVCMYAGLRVSEALGLTWADVDFAAGTLGVTGQLGANGERVPVKTSASAAPVPLLPALARELRAHHARQRERGFQLVRPETALVFTTARGRPQSRRNALRAVHRAGDVAGLNGAGREPVGLHDLRHSYCALALDSGASIAEVAALARHADARVTAAVYAGLADDGRQKAAQKLLDAGFGR